MKKNKIKRKKTILTLFNQKQIIFISMKKERQGKKKFIKIKKYNSLNFEIKSEK